MITVKYENIKVIFTDSRINLSYKHQNPHQARMNWEKLKEKLKLKSVEIAYLTQIHSNKVKIVEKGGWQGWGDGLITEKENLALITFLADCTPVVIFDKDKKVIANLHCGWRSLSLNIIEEAIKLINNITNNELIAIIGPSARSCCYEVSRNFVTFFKNYYSAFKERDGKLFFDIVNVIESKLKNHNVTNIITLNMCTICQDNFFSFRRTKGKERQVCLVFKQQNNLDKK